ncbi:hypothetical protein NPX13_g5500 [Xylaria arbuscula]|uniref:Uncharacterized protein n=1 Tax=Xylaria arbuscula TaxID=114810 RepID=A0A9W8TMM8_9PEZI|nr:hypothetical protein NPX13_g5500 [Xylaria arbuscula]
MFSEDPTIQNDDTMLQYEGDGDRAVKNIKDVMTAMKYLQDGTIAQRLRAQKERIAGRFRELDVNQLPNWVRKDLRGNSVWPCVTARAKAVAHIDEHIPKLMEAYINDFKREQAEKQAAAGDMTLKNLIEKIEMIDAEWTRYKPMSWTNPF